jgi:hypothetical protein
MGVAADPPGIGGGAPTRGQSMRPAFWLAVGLMVASTGLGGCYVVPAPPPPPGGALIVPPYVQARPQCGWSFGSGWYGWGWYNSFLC